MPSDRWNSGKPGAGNPPARFEEGGGGRETGPSATRPIRFPHCLEWLPARPSTPDGLTVNIACDLFVDETADNDLLRVEAGVPLIVADVVAGEFAPFAGP
jgi:hypothetical protein